jgi:hypothetical protein
MTAPAARMRGSIIMSAANVFAGRKIDMAVKMKNNNEIYILFTCDEWKSYAGMKCIAASTDINSMIP